MDIELANRINEVTAHLKKMSEESVDYKLMDPVVRMMLVALLHESQKIQDYLSSIGQRLTDKYCEDFIPREEIVAMPALALVEPSFRDNKDDGTLPLVNGASFLLRHTESKTMLSYMPLFSNTLVPYNDIYILTPGRMRSASKDIEVATEIPNVLWIGIETKAEVETLKGLSLYIENGPEIYPNKISAVSSEKRDLIFTTMNRIEDIEMMEPFDAQQASPMFMSVMRYWREYLEDMDDATLLYITDELNDRDVFKRKPYPRTFQNWLESYVLKDFPENTMWLQVEYPQGVIVPDNVNVRLNVMPVVNVDVNTVTLTQSSPIAKLQKQDNSFFVQVLETTNAQHNQGFGLASEEFFIRDFDAACYNNGDLYRDVRNLYNHFIEDYYAFIEYNTIKDGADIKHLKELINKIGKGVGTQNSKYKFDSGTYAMKNINQFPQTLSTKVSYLTTQGKLGNILDKTSEEEEKYQKDKPKLECKKMPLLKQYATVVRGAEGGRDKATADMRYELIRYYTLTNDRLFTRMDIEAFVRMQLISMYGKEEFDRIFINIRIEGAAGLYSVQRGIYIDIEFKDDKNYRKALTDNVEKILLQKIHNKSCIAMPINVTLVNLEK